MINSYLNIFWGMLYEMAPYTLFGMFAAGVVHELLGNFKHFSNFARKRNIVSLSVFNLAGLTLPVCSCGVVPLAVGMKKQGIPLGNIFCFLFSAPATSITAIIRSLAMLGTKFTLYYVCGALVCGYCIGFLFYSLEKGQRFQIASNMTTYVCLESDHQNGIGFWHRALRWSTFTYGSRISLDLIIGLALVAFIMNISSVHNFATMLNDLPYYQAAALMIMLTIPLYICSLPGIIVAATLVMSGIQPDLVWLFLMAGPVSNFGDINVLRRAIGWRFTWMYIVSVVITIFFWGLVIRWQVDFMEVWVVVREFFSSQSGTTGTGFTEIFAGNKRFSVQHYFNLISAIMMILLVLNGAKQVISEFYKNPCLHCGHYQKDINLTPVLCTIPCWKKRLINTIKRRKRNSLS